jgi:hypothetical protein
VELPTIKYLRHDAADVEITNAHLSTRARIHMAQSVVGGATMSKTLSNGLLKFGTAVLVLLTNMVAEIIVATVTCLCVTALAVCEHSQRYSAK